MVGTLVDLFSIYKWPTTNIKAANTIVNKAFANWWTWFILPHPIKRFYVGRTLFRSIEFRPIRTKRVTQRSRKSFDFTGYWQPYCSAVTQ